MPSISLRLRGQLADRLPGGSAIIEIGSGITLDDFLGEHGLGARHYVVMLNNTVAPARDSVLKNGDSIVVYPQMAGG
ncbi:MAG: MoaD/ThiS family protein [Acidimicrobiaceae bacterium]|nr:MoaD/ThiS family protein [Acidimicrobiaceae bacterium]